MTHILMMNIADVTDDDYLRLYRQSDRSRQSRADRYLRQDDKVRCICAGFLLRLALGKDDFEIETDTFGKPMVKDMPDFYYNLSHSGNWVVIAYGNCPVGIDVEQVRWNCGKEDLARRYFTVDEQDFVFGQSQQGIAARFFEIWTSKESYLKYLGTGLRKSLDSFSVLQLSEPNRFSVQLDGQYYMTLWTQAEGYDMNEISVSDLLNIWNKTTG